MAANFFDQYWGAYVSFLKDTDSQRLLVCRDPTGALPCQFLQHDGVTLFFSDVRDIARWPFLRFTPSTDYLLANIMLPKFQKNISGLEQVGEVLPGECLTLHGEGMRRKLLWNPFEIASNAMITDRATAVQRVREVVQNTTSTLATSYDHILHNIGGLDSSIVLSCLAEARAGQKISCINFYTESARGDERQYAREAARHHKVPLAEILLDSRRVDLGKLFDTDPQSAPMGVFDCTAVAGGLYDYAATTAADALFYGVGGDNVFFQMPYILSALDYMQSATRDNPARVLAEAAAYGNKSYFYIIKALLKESIRPLPCFDYVYRFVAPTSRWPFINLDILAMGPQKEVLHPGLCPIADYPKGKFYHILTSAFMSLEYYDQWQTDYSIERIHPLLAQPVIETCLRTPTWFLVDGGLDRGLARRAFAEQLAPAVAWRTSKSNPDELYEQIYNVNLDLLKDVLLNGSLVGERILLREPLEAMLSGKNLSERVAAPVALEFLSWEIWRQQWRDRR